MLVGPGGRSISRGMPGPSGVVGAIGVAGMVDARTLRGRVSRVTLIDVPGTMVGGCRPVTCRNVGPTVGLTRAVLRVGP